MLDEYKIDDNLCIMKTNKYKTVSLYLYFAHPYTLKKKLALSLLTYFLGDYSNKYNTKEKMLKAKDNLYGASIYSQCKNKANLLFYFVKFNFINPKFLKDVTIDDYLDYFNEVFNNVYFSEELLVEFKKNYKDTISRRLDNPSNYASNRIHQIIGKEVNEFLVYDSDHIAEIDAITLDDIKEVYDDLFKTFSLNVFLYGDVDQKMIDFAKSFKTVNRYYLDNKTLDVNDLKEIVEDKNVSQSMLSVIYKTPYHRTSKDFYAYMLGNCLLGIVPTSLLFEEVREKLSLCYYISVIDFKNEGIVKIFTAIDGKNKDTVIEQINIQINRLINKDYDTIKIDLARTLLIQSLETTFDDFDAYIDHLYYNSLNQVSCSIDEYIKNLDSIDADDISNVFKTYKHVLTYMLNGVKHEEDI